MFFPGRSVIKGSPGFLPVALKTPLCSAYAIAAECFLVLFFSFFLENTFLFFSITCDVTGKRCTSSMHKRIASRP